jgi:RNA polymerase sigma factor (sigma-70 family)
MCGGVDWATICMRLRLDANDQAAWEALDARVRTWTYGRLRGLRTDLLEDAVADVCSSVVMDLPAAHGPDTFRGFVLGKCLNAVKGAVRHAERQRVPLEQALDLPARSIAEADDPRFQVIDRCLEGLPDRELRAVELRYYAEARTDQIARELGVSEGNARRIVFNGLNRLRKCARSAVGSLTSGSRG